MQELEVSAGELLQAVQDAKKRIGTDDLQQRLHELRAQSEQADFWQDNTHAQSVMKEISKLDARVTPWITLEQNTSDTQEMIQLGDASSTLR